jgi:flagellar basal-body rod protein FlgG
MPGFHTLTSGMLTQQKKIDISSNNISNINTSGYKKEQSVTTNFGNLLIHKMEQSGIHQTATPMGNVSLIKTMEENNTIHSQGTIEETGVLTDFAIMGSGFFGINENGNKVYTRNGSFNIDEDGYLFLQGVGRVQGENGDLYIGTDKFDFSVDGNISVDGSIVDKIVIYDFLDYNNLEKVGEGKFSSNLNPNISENIEIRNKTIERSNVDVTKEMTDMMSSQRALQTASQALKILDMVQEKAVSEIGKL